MNGAFPPVEALWRAWTGEAPATVNSRFVGTSISGKKRVFLLYANTAPTYRTKCAVVVAKEYEGFVLQ